MESVDMPLDAHGDDVENTFSRSLNKMTKLPLLTKVQPLQDTSHDGLHSNTASPTNKLKQSSLIYQPDHSVLDTIAQRISNLSIKPRQNGIRQKLKQANQAKQNKQRTNKDSKNCQSPTKSAPASIETPHFQKSDESLRWENILEDSDEERERIRMYKMNRRKRYLAAAQAKGLGWALNYSVNNANPSSVNNSNSSSFQITEDCGMESLRGGANSFNDFSPMRRIRPTQTHGLIASALVEC